MKEKTMAGFADYISTLKSSMQGTNFSLSEIELYDWGFSRVATLVLWLTMSVVE